MLAAGVIRQVVPRRLPFALSGKQKKSAATAVKKATAPTWQRARGDLLASQASSQWSECLAGSSGERTVNIHSGMPRWPKELFANAKRCLPVSMSVGQCDSSSLGAVERAALPWGAQVGASRRLAGSDRAQAPCNADLQWRPCRRPRLTGNNPPPSALVI